MNKARKVNETLRYERRLLELQRPLRKLVDDARKAGIGPGSLHEEVTKILTEIIDREPTRHEQSKGYVRIKLLNGGSYIQPLESLDHALDGELDPIFRNPSGPVTIRFSPCNITDEEFDELPEFSGH